VPTVDPAVLTVTNPDDAPDAVDELLMALTPEEETCHDITHILILFSPYLYLSRVLL
jgi:hypothetical protein